MNWNVKCDKSKIEPYLAKLEEYVHPRADRSALWKLIQSCNFQSILPNEILRHCLLFELHDDKVYVTRSGKTSLNRTFCVLRNIYLKNSMHRPSLVVQYNHTRCGILIV